MADLNQNAISNPQGNSAQQSTPQSSQRTDPLDQTSNHSTSHIMANEDRKVLKKADLNKIVKKNSIIPVTLFDMKSDKLTKDNFDEFRKLFEIKMRSVKLWQFVDPTVEWDFELLKDDDWIDLNFQAQDNLKANVETYLLNYIEQETTAKRMYQKITSHFEGTTVLRGWRLSSKLVREINLLRNRVTNLIPKRPFVDLVRELSKSAIIGDQLRWQSVALDALQVASEDYSTRLMEMANVFCHHAKSVTLNEKDIRLADNILRPGQALTAAAMHLEDLEAISINIARFGSAKVWLVIPPSHKLALIEAIRVALQGRAGAWRKTELRSPSSSSRSARRCY